jgi:hypothetical protein
MPFAGILLDSAKYSPISSVMNALGPLRPPSQSRRVNDPDTNKSSVTLISQAPPISGRILPAKRVTPVIRLKRIARTQRDSFRFALFKLRTFFSTKERFECPVCSFTGPFMDLKFMTGLRKHAKCPSCGALERHRLQYMVLRDIIDRRDASKMKMLHFAPESWFRPIFAAQFAQYVTADLYMKDVDYSIDMQDLPFADESYDFILASIVLDYIKDDERAIKEVRRVLRPNGFAMFSVSLVGEKTIEYSEPNPHESGHVRISGLDYFDRFKAHFTKVETVSSDSFPDKYQLFIYEDRSRWSKKEYPFRPRIVGEKQVDVVGVCYTSES